MTATITGSKKKGIVDVKAVLENIRANPRILFFVAAAAAISIVIALMFWAKEPDYRVLYSNISEEDGGAVVTQLKQMQVPYRFAEHDGSIEIPSEQIYEVRLKLAQQGLPKGGSVGFELLDQEKFGISQFNEQVNFQRALEGELSRTIETLGPVHSARVHLAMPKPSLFLQDRKEPSASVTLNLINGRTLDSGQVSAITFMISSAVPGLSADRVTIVDQSGHMMSQSGAQATQTTQLQYVRKMESDYQRRIQAILAPIVGTQNVRTQVTAQVDFTQHEQTAEQYQPNSRPENMAIRSRQSSNNEQGGKNAVGGVPGALSNQPPAPVSTPIEDPAAQQANRQGGANGNNAAPAAAPAPTLTPYNKQSDETTNYEVDKTLTHIKRNTGVLERLSVAVVVNYKQGKDGKPVALNKAQLDQINALVKEVMGFSDKRGDTLNVVNTIFTDQEEEAPVPLWKQPEFIKLMLSGARYLFVALIAWILWRKAVQPFWIRHQEMLIQRLEMEKEVRQAELDEQVRKRQSAETAKAQQRVETEQQAQHLREMADQEPQVIALVIRQWLNKEHKSS
ncbi:flagellar basal body M-ring protein FliF [Kosakonia cowanii]|uniref:flagellar basal-body MS-ring/collar protein FliF n=1 Tax=Kosakonia cowanii TaxID=208223 RepID=UPI00111FF1E8|nr:flagellar basal-body MS-ring/collar protein FliF [Kosakonia cowanii]MDP9768845.1 flagellar M-ring protein FliF [Atlantibacter hermannii]TPD65032.1 flagellar basal body M-ring protein FliF [Kosakonia cowanii]TPD89217.1 flagellar basal body M-ring protein FliF [Kosakonia cowanii]TPE05659.1 flagellar basal body M-ring protein FliF [Kosakonia cowanii]